MTEILRENIMVNQANESNDNKEFEYENAEATVDKLLDIKDYTCNDKPFLEFYKNQHQPLIFNSSLFNFKTAWPVVPEPAKKSRMTESFFEEIDKESMTA